MLRTSPSFALSLALSFAVACGGEGSAEVADEGGLDDAICMGAKCDAITPDTDPANLGFKIDYRLADEGLVGTTMTSAFTPFSAPTYYPFTTDGINVRSNYTESSLPASGLRGSPAEKYDLAYSGWAPDEAFWLLRKLTGVGRAEFDAAYYEQLGPVATWEHNEHGLGRLHDGVDNDQDGKIDADDDDNEGLESWFGYCNGNTAASLSVPGPEHDTQFDGVTFSKNDIAALLAAVHYDDRSTMTGLRCESLKPVQDAYGRLLNEPWFRPDGAEETDYRTFDILQGPGWIDDENVGYLVAPSDAKPGEEKALLRLPLEEFNKYRQEVKAGELSYDQQSWIPVQFSVAGSGCRDTNPATVYLAVTNLLGAHQIPFAIDADPASHVWNYPIYEAKVGRQEIIDEKAALEALELGEEVTEYPFNDDAVGFARVGVTLLKSHSMNLDMVLELDADERIIGGEWVGGSKTRHPDFIWLPMGADSTGYNTEGTYVTFGDDQHDGQKLGDGSTSYTDAPDMRYSDVRRLLAASRTSEEESYTEYDGDGRALAADGVEEFSVNVDEPGRKVSQVLVYLDATAEFVPGLQMSLRSPSGAVVSLFDVPVDNREWGPGRFPNGYDLGTIAGVAHPMPLLDKSGHLHKGLATFEGEEAHGDWTLSISNSGGGAAALAGWSLWLTSVGTAD